MLSIASPFSNALVGRFATGQPPMETIRKFIVSLGLKGDCPVGLLDTKHILLRPMATEDFARLWCRGSWCIGKFPITISKWTIGLRPNQESSLAPIWVSFPSLPIPLFDKRFLLGGLLGRPLKVDDATASLKRPAVARILMELDVKKDPKTWLWVGDESWGFWQKVEYENLPPFCHFCSRVGHIESSCHKKFLELIPDRKRQEAVDKGKKKMQQRYIPKEQPILHCAPSGAGGLIHSYWMEALSNSSPQLGSRVVL